MGLLGGIARTAVVAGTATTVSNRVSRRQARKWSGRGEPIMAPYEQQPQYQQPPPQYQQPPPQYQQPYPPPPAAPPAGDDLTAKLDRLTVMRDHGQLTEEEFAAAKAKLLGL
ncbi:MAG TPA: SHOCT domain-containing protein [Micromonosporaceae bacterium]|nr:SHOCT domain-containing protein [Micromonosporaceae bacterium]